MITNRFTSNTVFLLSQEFILKLVNDNNNFRYIAKPEKEP